LQTERNRMRSDKFLKASRRRRVPVVLSKAEVQRLWSALAGTYQLMGQVLYGTGLRLLELLRLATVNRVEQTVVGRGSDFADVVVREALGKVSDAIGIPLLIAVGDFGRSGDGEFVAGRGHANLKTLRGALIAAKILAAAWCGLCGS